MSLFQLTNAQIETEVMRLLTELAERQHAGDVEKVRVQWVMGGHATDAMLFAPHPEFLGAGTISQVNHDSATLAHWLNIVPALSSVTIIVREGPVIVRTATLKPPHSVVRSASSVASRVPPSRRPQR